MLNKIVITGMGVVAPQANNVEELYANFSSGKSTSHIIQTFDTSGHKCHIACEASNFAPEAFLDRKVIKRTSRFIQMALIAAGEAVRMSGLDITEDNNIATFIGTGAGGFDFIDVGYEKFYKRGPASATPFAITNIIPNMAASNVAIEFGLHGPCSAPVAACASGLYAISDACDFIRLGKGEVAVCGAAESTMTSYVLSGYEALRVLSTNNDEPEKASRPFDAGRDGFVMGEGAGVLVIETYEHAVRRGAEIIAEIPACFTSCDAAHITSPDTSAKFIKKTISKTLENAGIAKDDLAFVSAHGTSTKVNDQVEALAISETLGYAVPVTAVKSMIGHTLGASGAIAAIAAVQSLRNGLITPTINIESFDSEIAKINLVTEPQAIAEKEYALINAFGFGGHNACVLIKKAEY